LFLYQFFDNTVLVVTYYWLCDSWEKWPILWHDDWPRCVTVPCHPIMWLFVMHRWCVYGRLWWRWYSS